jgi:hypothetical protein
MAEIIDEKFNYEMKYVCVGFPYKFNLPFNQCDTKQ